MPWSKTKSKRTKEEIYIHKLEYNRNYRKTHPEFRKKIVIYNKNYRKTHLEDCRKNLRKSERKRRKDTRNKIFKLLGSKCSNPNCAVIGGMTDKRALQIDHINGGGNKARKKVNATKFYLNILKEIEAGSKDYQLFCANCNWIKRWENKEQMQPMDNDSKVY
jgi:hypothetical protein